MSSVKNKISSEEFDLEGELTVEQLRDIQEMQEQVLTRRTKKAKKNQEDYGEIIEIESDNESTKSAKKRKRDKKRKETEQEITSTNVLKNILDPNIKSNDKDNDFFFSNSKFFSKSLKSISLCSFDIFAAISFIYAPG